jgi:hypothetical protein
MTQNTSENIRLVIMVEMPTVTSRFPGFTNRTFLSLC